MGLDWPENLKRGCRTSRGRGGCTGYQKGGCDDQEGGAGGSVPYIYGNLCEMLGWETENWEGVTTKEDFFRFGRAKGGGSGTDII